MIRFNSISFTWRNMSLFLLCVFFAARSFAQVNPSYRNYKATLSGSTQLATSATTLISNINPTVAATQLKYDSKSAALQFRLDLGEDYIKTQANWTFTVTVNVSCVIAATTINKTLQITHNTPELIKTADILTTVNSNSTGVLPVSITVNSFSVSSASGNTLLQNFISDNQRLTVSVVREFRTDVRYMSTGLVTNPLMVNPIGITNRLVNFSWQDPSQLTYPDYEVQILKLYNTDAAFSTNTGQISTEVDWSRALKVETQSFQKQINLTMAEGSGYYLWRVRPIGTYYDGGIANSENYGQWSYALPTSTANITLTKNVLQSSGNPTPYAFYFTDPDENLNWIYSRVFTEGDNQNQSDPSGLKSSEGIDYANGLLMSRQSQKYNSSENTNVVSQTMIDYSGRPALSTIPVPLQGNLNGYKLDFVKNTSGQLYTALQFDADSKLNDPDKVDNGVNSNFKYYSQYSSAVNNANVPDAKGYPFKRTLFKTDGTNRVTEESGVGEAHSLGLQANGRGRTTQMLYCTPSEDELIRIFGDEAPLAESVIKTITIDQNNVTSVSYTSKEGKTIATALISETNSNLQNLKQASTSLDAIHNINNKIVSGNKIVSSKRIAIPVNNTLVKLSYLNNSSFGNSGNCASGNCAFNMRFYLIDMKNNVTYVSDAVATTTNVVDHFTPSNPFSFPSTWVFDSRSATIPDITPGGTNFDELTLNAGEYVFVKEVFTPNPPNYADSLVNAQNESTKPLIDAILNKMKSVNSFDASTSFNVFIEGLRCRLNAYNSLTPGCNLPYTITSDSILKYLSVDQSVLPLTYTVPFASSFTISALTTNKDDPTQNDFSITTGCCNTLNTSLPKPPVCYLCEGSPDPSIPDPNTKSLYDMASDNHKGTYASDQVMPYGMNDFKSHPAWDGTPTSTKLDLINDLVYHEFILLLNERLLSQGLDSTYLWKYAPGHTYTSLKMMLANMLISQYYTGNTVFESGKWFAADYDEASGGYNLTTPVGDIKYLPYNYDCKTMFDAWYSNLEIINTFQTGNDDNILNTFNDRDEPGSGQNNGDDDENWQVKNKVVKFFLKRKISAEMEEFSGEPAGTISSGRKESVTSFINLFMDEVGLQFAAIMDGAPLPGYIQTGPSPAHPLEFDATNYAPYSGPPNIFRNDQFNSTNYDFPITFNVNNNIANETNINSVCGTYNEMYYPYILKPEWQFKYFNYNVFNETNYIDDKNLYLAHQVDIDLQRIYNLPASYVPGGPSNICQTPAPLSYSVNGSYAGTFSFTHENWSSSQRLSFYNAIKFAPKCSAEKGVASAQKYDPNTGPPTCPPDKAALYTEAMNILDNTITSISERRAEFRTALQNELAASCYTIVACKTGPAPGIVSEKEITIMVDSVVSQAQALIKAIKKSLILAVGTNSNTAPTGCTPYAAYGTTYGTGSCDLPTCTYENCTELVFADDNSLQQIASAKIDIKLFTDCDQKILDMINGGYFLPDIAPASGIGVTSPCTTTAQKPWLGQSCVTGPADCAPVYQETQSCSPSPYKTYSQPYTITATGN